MAVGRWKAHTKFQSAFSRQAPIYRLSGGSGVELLLRLGYSVKLDDEKFPSSFRPVLFDLEEPSYLIFYALRTRDDGVRAFLAGDDQTAAERLFQFDRLWAELRLRIPEKDPEVGIFQLEFAAPILGSRWREMLFDAKRRLEAPTKKENLQPVHKRTVQELIDSLEDVTWPRFHYWKTKGNPPPEFIQLIQEGKSAIEPLLRCIEEDERWTRIVVHDYKWRSEEEGGLEKGDPLALLQVRDLAYMALEQVLEYSTLEEFAIDWNDPEQQRRVRMGELREFCERYEYQTSGELWYRILADEEASAELQKKAAIFIARNAGTRYLERDGYGFSYRIDYYWSSYRYYSGLQSLLVGETLKNKREPSVMELLEKAWRRERARIDELEENGEFEQYWLPVIGGRPRFDHAYLLLSCLEEVEPGGNQKLLQEHMQWLMMRIEEHRKARDSESGDSLLLDEAEEMLMRRFDGQFYGEKDPEIIADYQELIDFCLKHKFDVPLKLMELYPKLEGLDAIASKLFLEKEAPYELMGDASRWYELWEFGFWEKDFLLRIPSFRQAALQALKSEDLVGEVFFAENGDKQLLIEGLPNFEEGELKGQKHPLRRCDLLSVIGEWEKNPRL